MLMPIMKLKWHMIYDHCSKWKWNINQTIQDVYQQREYNIVEIRQNEHQSNYMTVRGNNNTNHPSRYATLSKSAKMNINQTIWQFAALLCGSNNSTNHPFWASEPGYCSRYGRSDLILQLSWMFSSRAHHDCSTKNLINNIYKLRKNVYEKVQTAVE
jgi:hypothetical protein